MVTRTIILMFVLVANSVVAAERPRRSKTEVVRLANAEARRHGYKLRDFGLPEPHYNYTRRDDTWVVFYEGKVITTGNHFTVYVADKTKKIWLMPGR